MHVTEATEAHTYHGIRTMVGCMPRGPEVRQARTRRYAVTMRYRLATMCLGLLGLAAAPVLGHADPKLEIAPKAPRPGDPVLVTVSGVDKAPKGHAGKTPLTFFAVRQGWQALVAVPIEDAPPELKIVLTEPALSQAVA